jgi:hypothetical protein
MVSAAVCQPLPAIPLNTLSARGCVIEMKRLWVEFAGEAKDVLLANRLRGGHECLTDPQIIEVQQITHEQNLPTVPHAVCATC